MKQKKKQQKRKKESIKKKYETSLQTIRKAKTPILIGLSAFIIAILLGYFYPHLFEKELLKILQEIIESIQGKNATETAYTYYSTTQKQASSP